jgi:hypothetical protein
LEPTPSLVLFCQIGFMLNARIQPAQQFLPQPAEPHFIEDISQQTDKHRPRSGASKGGQQTTQILFLDPQGGRIIAVPACVIEQPFSHALPLVLHEAVRRFLFCKVSQ